MLLRGYFEPTDNERLRDLKVPTAAHRTMAQLALSGHVRLFLTTNFDRLLEKALDDVGIVPQVLSTPDSIGGAVPFGQTKCTIVKLNGDYMDTRIKNTPEELATYHSDVDSLLDRVIDEFGFIISGWSAEWDTALRDAFERSQTQRYSMFWASRNPPRQDAARLIEQLHGEFVPIRDVDSFFSGIGEGLARLQGAQTSKVLSPAAEELGGSSVPVGAELPTGLITYLFTDVEGSTTLWQQYPQEEVLQACMEIQIRTPRRGVCNTRRREGEIPIENLSLASLPDNQPPVETTAVSLTVEIPLEDPACTCLSGARRSLW